MNEDKVATLITVAMAFMFIVMGFIFANGILSYDIKYVTVDSEITNVDVVVDNSNEIDYLIVNFANGEAYKIRVDYDVDLTVNSRLILELGNAYHRNWFWEELEPNDDVYFINKIVKVPD